MPARIYLYEVKVANRGGRIASNSADRLAGAGSRLRKYTIGPYRRVTLAMARTQAQKIFAARLDGRDAAQENKQLRRRLVVDRIDDLVETFIQERVSKTRSARRIMNLLACDLSRHVAACIFKALRTFGKSSVFPWLRSYIWEKLLGRPRYKRRRGQQAR